MGLQVVEQDADISRPLISDLMAAVYPPEVLAVMPWRDVQSARSQRCVMVLDEDDSIVATAGLLVRDAVLDEVPVKIGGVGGVMTNPARQGLGIRTHGNGRRCELNDSLGRDTIWGALL